MSVDNEKILEKALKILEEFNDAEKLQLCAMILSGMSLDLKKEVNLDE